MKEHYILDKVTDIDDYESETMKKLERESKIKRITAQLNEQIDQETWQLKQRICERVCKIINQEA